MNYGKAIIAVALIAAATVIGVTLINDGTAVDANDSPVVLSAPAEAETQSRPPARTIDADDVPIEASDMKRVERASLEIAGGGTVTEIDRSDDVGEAYEVEVVTKVGEVDIALDDDLNRVPNLRYDD